ncbi:hypothetical protein C7271_15925 [filamentous cyanobacterium CCP5]|nr:hypothetical protein C7271_15925 [filamentous cyanobacterium CCP5]
MQRIDFSEGDVAFRRRNAFALSIREIRHCKEEDIVRTGAWLLVLVLAAVGCRSATDEVATPEPTVAVQVTNTPAPIPIEGTPYQATPLDPTRAGVLIADTDNAAINLRSQPTTQSAPTGTGTAGDQLELLQLAEGEGGYSWYLVKSIDSGAEGWVRGDFIETDSNVAAIPANACGDDSQRAFFETESFANYICEGSTGLRYVGINKTNQKSFVTEEVEVSQGTYIAFDGSIQYHLNDATLAVYRVNQGEYTQLLGESILHRQRSY